MNKKAFTPLETLQTPTRKTKSLTGFTLIELMVVVAVLGMLAAILVPALGSAREAARRALCISNLRQHGIAWYLYLDDHNDCFPRGDLAPRDGGVAGGSFGGWYGIGYAGDPEYAPQYRVLNRYLDAETGYGIFHCPDDIKPSDYTGTTITTFDRVGNSYELNYGVFATGWRRPLLAITSPHNKVYLEQCDEDNNPSHGGENAVVPRLPVMVLFVDGHVAGPFLWDDDREDYDPNTGKKVLRDVNGTANLMD